LEIPYRQAKERISTLTLEHIRGAIQQQDLQDILDSYFYYTLRSLENAAQMIRPGGKLCIFVGNPKIGGVEVEIWRIIAEYFQERNYEIENIYEDKIKNRKLFRNRKNNNPEGMQSEFLLIMRKQQTAQP